MADIKRKGLHTVTARDKKEYEHQLREHRLEVLRRTIIAAVVVLFFVGGTALYMTLRQYTDYDIRNSVKRVDAHATNFREFQGNILKYSNDGAFYTDHSNEMIWNQTYEMSNPTIDICGNYLVIYDKKGTDIYILNKEGLVQSLEMNYPVTQVSVAEQGTIAVLMDNQAKGLLSLYDKEGNLLVSGAIHSEKGGYPVTIALSDDGIKLGVSILDVKGGSVKSTIAFYNFGSVGENAIDHIVAVTTYEDMFIPELDFVSKDCMLAVADKGIIVFEGAQTPKESTRIEILEEIKSIFYNKEYIGVITDNLEDAAKNLIRVYDLKGKVMMEEASDVDYSKVELLSSNEVCISNRTICDIYTIRGVFKFHYEFEEELYQVIPGGSSLNYTFILNGVTEQARLK